MVSSLSAFIREAHAHLIQPAEKAAIRYTLVSAMRRVSGTDMQLAEVPLAVAGR